MLIGFKRGQGSIVIRVKILNSSVTTGAGLTGLTFSSSGLIISTIADNESSATAYTVAGSTIETITTLGTFAAPTATKCRFKEVDSTNHKGIYEIQIADARYAVSSAKSILVSISGATNAAETDVVIPLRDLDPYDSVRAGLTALPNTACTTNASLITAGTGTSQLSVSSGQVILQAGTGTGQLDFTSGVLKSNLTQIAGTAWASTTLFTLASHDPGATIGTGTSTLTQTQVTGGAYALNSASFAFNSGLDFTTTQKAATLARVTLTDTATTVTNQLTAAAIATGVWTDTVAGDFTTALSIGKSVMNGVSLGTGLTVARCTLTDTLTTYTGNTVQTGDSFARIGATGSGLASLAPASTALSTATWTGTLATNLGTTNTTVAANLDAAVSGRMATYTQPTGFLAATFPATVASPTNITAGTITTVTNLTNAPTAGDFTSTMKTSLNAATPASVVGAVGSVTAGVALAATGLDAITATAPAGVASTFPAMVVQLWRRFFAKSILDADGATLKTYANDGTTVVTTQTVTTVGNVETQGPAS